MTSIGVLVRLGLAASLAVGGFVHAYLYVHGYQHIPTIGPAFLVQASLSFAVAVLILVGGPWWLLCAGAVVAAGSLVAFTLSRTVGVFGFSERGWDPSPYAVVSIAAEVVTVVLWAGVFGKSRFGQHEFVLLSPGWARPDRPGADAAAEADNQQS